MGMTLRVHLEIRRNCPPTGSLNVSERLVFGSNCIWSSRMSLWTISSNLRSMISWAKVQGMNPTLTRFLGVDSDGSG
jgi:hypothetical protein